MLCHMVREIPTMMAIPNDEKLMVLTVVFQLTKVEGQIHPLDSLSLEMGIYTKTEVCIPLQSSISENSRRLKLGDVISMNSVIVRIEA
jgi:hypothetical protein